MTKVALPESASQGGLNGPLGTTCEIGAPPPADLLLRRLYRYRLQSYAGAVLPEERVKYCHKRMQPRRATVNVMKAKDKAYYQGLMTCGSVWLCPVCAFKISESRRREIEESIQTWEARGGKVLMVTWTVPHYDFQPLSQVLTGFGKARILMMHRKPFKGLKLRIGLAGTIRALEVTFTENGWHVHVHELFFTKPGFNPDLYGMSFDLLSMWRSACVTVGLGKPNVRGVQVQDGSVASQYAAKWGLDCEMTKSHVKQGREGSMTPWDFLRECEEELFREYAKCFKGKRQLVWSEGLRKLLGLGQMKTDEEVAGQVEEESILLGQLDKFQWETILRADRRAELLQVAETAGWSGILNYVANLIRGDECPF
jgi:hypothetical protein